MSKQTPLSLLGYPEMEAEFKLADGRLMSAGELIGNALQLYHQEYPGLDESQLALAWNSLSDAERKGFCIRAFDDLDADLEAGAAAVDQHSLMKEIAPTVELKLGESILALVVESMRRLRAPWDSLREDEQDIILESITHRTKGVARATVRALATRGNHHLVATLDQVTIKKGAKLVLSIQSSQVNEHLTEAVQTEVMLVLAPALEEIDEIEQPRAALQQPPLPLDDGNGVVHSDPKD